MPSFGRQSSMMFFDFRSFNQILISGWDATMPPSEEASRGPSDGFMALSRNCVRCPGRGV
jgi:hypothetical protein